MACIVVDDASADAGAHEEIADATARAFVGLRQRRARPRARNAGLAAVARRARRIRRLRLRARPPGGSSRCSATSTTRWWPRWRPGSSRSPAAAARLGATRRCARRSTGAPGGAGATGEPRPLRPERRARRPERRGGRARLSTRAARRRGRRPGLAAGRGRLGRPLRAGEHRRARRAADLGAFLARQAFYGRPPGRSPAARRRAGPVEVSAWSLAVWGLILARRPALAQAALAASVAILARRLRASCATR